MIQVYSVILLTSLSVVQVLGIPTRLRTLTLYTVKRTWNEARFVCEAGSGHLVYTKNSQELMFVKKLCDQEPWASEITGAWDGIYIGLYNKVGTKPGKFSWVDCEELETYSDWQGNGPYDTENKFCTTLHTGWYTTDCYKKLKFICEHKGGACHYDQVSNTKGVDPNAYDAGPISVTECQSYCDVALNDGLECWAITWTTATCHLHFTNTEDYFDDDTHTVTSSSHQLYRKICLSVAVDSSNIFPFSMESITPFSTCPSTGGTGKATVYTLFNTKVSWAQAKSICEGNSQRLVVLSSQQEGLKIQELYQSISTGIWIGLNGSNANGFTWVDGRPMNWEQFAAGHPPASSQTLCVVDTPSVNKWTAHSCLDTKPFICEKHDGKCIYERIDDVASYYEVYIGRLKQGLCKLECDATLNCVGFTIYSYFLTNKCYVYASTDPYYLRDTTNLRTENSNSLHIKTCSFGFVYDGTPMIPKVFEVVNVSEVVTTEQPTTTTMITTTTPTTTTTISTTTTSVPTTTTAITTTTTTMMTVATTTTPAQTKTTIAITTTLAPTTTTIAITTTLAPTTTTIAITTTLAPTTTTIAITTTIAPTTATISITTTLAPTTATPATTTITTTINAILTTTIPPPTTTTTTAARTSSQATMTTTIRLASPARVARVVCRCQCRAPVSTVDGATRAGKELKEKLLLNKTSLAKELRKKTSAQDQRASSQSMGYVSLTFISVVVGIMLLTDASSLFLHANIFKKYA